MWHLWGRNDVPRGFGWEKPERKRLLEKSRRRWQQNKVVVVSDTEKGVEWIYLA